MSDLLSIATQAASAGGTVLRSHAGRVEQVRTKSSASDLVTEVDIASGVAVVRAIAELRPSARFVVEEPEVYDLAGVMSGELTDDEVWVIDPLDGTTSYVHSYPCYSVSVAVLRSGCPAAGAVYDAARDIMFSARAGGGAWRDGTPMRVSAVPDVSEALVITGFPYDRGRPLDRQLAVLSHMLRRIHGVRRDGSAAIDCCHIANASADGFWEFGLKPWDLAAGVLIAEEAGAMVTGLDGGTWTPAVADVVIANPVLHPQLLEAVRIGLAEADLP